MVKVFLLEHNFLGCNQLVRLKVFLHTNYHPPLREAEFRHFPV